MANEKVKIFDGTAERWITISELKNLLRKEKPASPKKKTAAVKKTIPGHVEGCTCEKCFAKVMENL